MICLVSLAVVAVALSFICALVIVFLAIMYFAADLHIVVVLASKLVLCAMTNLGAVAEYSQEIDTKTTQERSRLGSEPAL